MFLLILTRNHMSSVVNNYIVPNYYTISNMSFVVILQIISSYNISELIVHMHLPDCNLYDCNEKL